MVEMIRAYDVTSLHGSNVFRATGSLTQEANAHTGATNLGLSITNEVVHIQAL